MKFESNCFQLQELALIIVVLTWVCIILVDLVFGKNWSI